MRRAPHAGSSGGDAYGALLDAVRGLQWRARRPSRIARPGIHPSRVRGTSAEFTEYRPYRHGDDLRRIDWKLFARSDRAHVRISEEHAVTPTSIVLDSSASMNFPDGEGSKWTVAQQLTVALASVSRAGGDPTGVIVTSRPAATIQPRTRRGLIAEMIRTLHNVTPAGSDALAPAVSAAARSAARIVIVSDFLGDLDDTLRAARELIASGRDVYALHVIARDELDPPAAMSVVMDPETPNMRRSLASETRSTYVRAFGEWRDATAARWLESGSAYRAIIANSEPISRSVRRIVRDEPVALARSVAGA